MVLFPYTIIVPVVLGSPFAVTVILPLFFVDVNDSTFSSAKTICIPELSTSFIKKALAGDVFSYKLISNPSLLSCSPVNRPL